MVEVDNFIDNLSAKMAGQTTDDYIKTREKALTCIDKIEEVVTKIKIKTFEDYNKGMKIKGVISSLYCYAFNHNNNIWKKVGVVEDIIGKKIFNFAKRHKIKDSKVKTVCRYILWKRYYYKQNLEKIYQFLLKNDVLRQNGCSFYIIGLHGKVGNNVFTVDDRGREHRTYVESCAFQAMYINSSTFIEYLNNRKEEIPRLEDRYSGVIVQDGKHCIRPIRLKYKEKQFIREEFCN